MNLRYWQFTLYWGASSHILRRKHVKVNSDNSTAVCYLKAMGGTKSPSCNNLVQDIWTCCIQNKVWLSSFHLPGALNVKADQQLDQFNERNEWHLREDVLEQISKIWGTQDIDLYTSWKDDPWATSVDALSFAWTGMFAYLFPTFCLIARCLNTLESDGALGLIVVPLWPTQAWLVNLLIATPVILPQHKDLLTLAHNGMEHPLKTNLRMVACLLPGSCIKHKEFHNQLPNCSWPPGEGAQKSVRCVHQKLDQVLCWKASWSISPTCCRCTWFLDRTVWERLYLQCH